MKRLQLEDLSQKLGYSKTLISMVLNGKGDRYGISKKTQAAVLEAVGMMNYTPNKFAKALRTGRSFFIGLIVSDIANPFYSKISKNIEQILHERGYSLMICSSDENEEKEKRLVEMMLNQQGADGLIIATTFKDSSYYTQPRFSNSPLVFIDRILPLYQANYVVIDNYGGSFELVKYLLDQACKKILCISGSPTHLSTTEDRINGYRDALSKSGLSDHPELVVSLSGGDIDENVSNILNEVQNTHKDLDAILALDRQIAAAVLKNLQQKEQHQLAKKVKIASFDDTKFFDGMSRPVISLSQPVADIGSKASLLLLDIIDGKQLSKSNIVLSTNLIVR
jgi:LacI family transcriptional regulator